tara:strand:+ start:70 stop:849 length:780 start_codon:yes stop_codon:yes gene_type:complete
MIKAKKSLGQNFLVDDNVIKNITNIVDIKNKDVLEIGPGTGNLTSALLKKNPKKVIVIEKDDKLASLLKEKFKNQIIILNKDVLDINEKSLNKDKLIVFGNLPYNISTEILCKWILNLKENYWFDALILMFQKEVADRIISKFNTKNYGRLTIISNWKLEIKKICDVKSTCFFPKPKINSTVLYFKPLKKFYPLKNPNNLEKITRIFFMHKRKMLKKPYNQLFRGDFSIAEKLNIKLDLRPQNLSFNTYYKLTDEYEKL